MSMFYTYYLGYLDDNNRIVPYGPYDNKGNLYELFSYDYHSDVNIHEGFTDLILNNVSDEFREELKSLYSADKEYDIERAFVNEWWGYRNLYDFIDGKTSMQQFIKTGYWKIDELSAFLSKSEKDREDALYYGELSDPLNPDVYAARVAIDPGMAKMYMYYAVSDTNTDDYYRYLTHVICSCLINDGEYKNRKYVIYCRLS